jgi:Putative prokaryotic signal transducing protein
MNEAHPELEPVNIYLAHDTIEAEFLRNILRDAGIEACVVGDAASRLLGVIPNAIGVPYLAVRRADDARAREILRDYEDKRQVPHTPDESTATWTCSACGEQVDEEFDLCWNCQNPRVPY